MSLTPRSISISLLGSGLLVFTPPSKAVDPIVEQIQNLKRVNPPTAVGGELDTKIPRERLKPLFDAPIRDTSITRGHDGAWYLTGNHDADKDGNFQNNENIDLWRSEDFKEWKPFGRVWSVASAGPGASAWQSEFRVNPENPRGPLVRGIVSPEIHWLKETYWIPYSMNGQGTGLLKSTTGKPEGPYTDLGRITEAGTDASLFQEEDGTVYWVIGQGFLAKMKPDLTGLAEAPKLLRPAFSPAGEGPYNADLHKQGGTQAPRTLGLAGAHLFKAEGRYWLTAAQVNSRIGLGTYDTMIAGSDSLHGPYGESHLMANHGGTTTVFQGPGDRLHATFAGRDSRAIFRDKPGAYPLVTDGSRLYATGKTEPFPRKQFKLNTEFGPWAELPLVAPYRIRDIQMMLAPDGYVYLTGSGTDNEYVGRVMLFRSQNMRQWEPVNVQFDFLSLPGATEEDRKIRFESPASVRNLDGKFMDTEIYFAGNTFHIFTSLYSSKTKRADGSDVWSGPMWLRSTTGKPEGPYEFVDRAAAQCSAFQDDDGKWFTLSNGLLRDWDPAGKSFSGGRTLELRTDSGTRFANGDVATNLTKIHGKYMVFATAWHGSPLGENYRVHGTYDWVYWQSDTLEGPYTMPRRAYAIPHAGHSSVPIKAPNGRWYCPFFGNEDTGPWLNMPGVLPLQVTLGEDDTVRVEVLDEVP